jgi:hypothetical protein
VRQVCGCALAARMLQLSFAHACSHGEIVDPDMTASPHDTNDKS